MPKTISAKLPDDLVREVSQSAAQSDRSVSAEIRRALRQYLNLNTDGAARDESGSASDGQARPPHAA